MQPLGREGSHRTGFAGQPYGHEVAVGYALQERKTLLPESEVFIKTTMPVAWALVLIGGSCRKQILERELFAIYLPRIHNTACKLGLFWACLVLRWRCDAGPADRHPAFSSGCYPMLDSPGLPIRSPIR